jgi:hypothetical protein
MGFTMLVAAGHMRTAHAADPASTASANGSAHSDESIRPYRIHVPQAQLDDLKRRIAQTRWPDVETVKDDSQGIQLAKVQALVRYWGTDYDWRKAEAQLNALPEFVTTIDGVDIQFIHVRSRNPNALPVILTHGWPGSTFEFIKAIGPLTNPEAYGGRAEDAFDVVIPSIPGYGFSGRPADRPGLGPRSHRARMGRADEAARLQAVRVAGWRPRLGDLRRPREASAERPAGDSPQYAGHGAGRSHEVDQQRRPCAGRIDARRARRL